LAEWKSVKQPLPEGVGEKLQKTDPYGQYGIGLYAIPFRDLK
jgi:hypothetical protein